MGVCDEGQARGVFSGAVAGQTFIASNQRPGERPVSAADGRRAEAVRKQLEHSSQGSQQQPRHSYLAPAPRR